MNTSTLQAQRNGLLQQATAVLGSMLPGLFRTDNADASAETMGRAASRQAAKLREVAAGYANSQPGFASDLYAAAARHESIYVD